MPGVGFTDKKDLTKWNNQDMQKAKGCYWMIDKQYKLPDKYFKKIKYVKYWYEKLCECLPSPELYRLHERTKNINIYWQLDNFSSEIRFARYDIVNKLYAYQHQKAEMLEEYSNKKSIPQIKPVYQEYSKENQILNEITQPLVHGSLEWQKRRSQLRIGYIPTQEILTKIPPMEVIDYAQHRLVKYDKLYGYFSAMISYPNELNKPLDIIYDKNASVVEMKAENIFDTSIDRYLKDKANPYGDKSYKEVDISNVQSVMNGNNDPLSIDIF